MPISLLRIKRIISQNVVGYFFELYTYFLYFVSTIKNRVPKTKVIVFCPGRSGSTLLINLLKKHPQIHCEGELLSRKVFSPHSFISFRSLISPKEVYGFKLLSYQLRDVQNINDPKTFINQLYDKGYKIIYLRRSNLLRIVLSVMYAEFKNEWHRTQEDKEAKQRKMMVDIKEMLKRLKESEDTYNYEISLIKNLPHIQINYEEDLENVADHARTIKKIVNFLNISYHLPPKPDLVKTTPRSFGEFIKNIDEVKEALWGTSYEKYLDDEHVYASNIRSK